MLFNLYIFLIIKINNIVVGNPGTGYVNAAGINNNIQYIFLILFPIIFLLRKIVVYLLVVLLLVFSLFVRFFCSPITLSKFFSIFE